MRASHFCTLILTTLAPLTTASRNSIGWELLTVYYAYKAEHSVVKNPAVNGPLDMARGCRGTGPNGLCTFNEFVSYVSKPRSGLTFNPGSEGDRNTVNPIIDEVGRDFQEYFTPKWGYEWRLLDDKKLNSISRAWINKHPGATMSLGRRMDNIYTTINYVKNTITPESARLQARNDDLRKCLDAADKATAARAKDLGKDILAFMKKATDWVGPGGGGKRTIIAVGKADYYPGGKFVETIDIAATKKASGISGNADEAAFKQFIVDARNGRVQGHHDADTLRSARFLKGHVEAAKAMKSFGLSVRSC